MNCAMQQTVSSHFCRESNLTPGVPLIGLSAARTGPNQKIH